VQGLMTDFQLINGPGQPCDGIMPGRFCNAGVNA
jgi:hypothetical protein